MHKCCICDKTELNIVKLSCCGAYICKTCALKRVCKKTCTECGKGYIFYGACNCNNCRSSR